jgi:hypothetical protein
LARQKVHEAKGENRSLRLDELQQLIDILSPNASLADGSTSSDDESALVTMMGTFGRDTSDDLRDARFYGPPSGLAFLQRTEELLTGSENVPQAKSTTSAIPQLFDPPTAQNDWDNESLSPGPLFPAKETALELLTVVLTAAYPLFPICDKPVLLAIINQVYSSTSSSDERPSQASMALLHIVLGIGYLFSKGEHRSLGCDGALKAA